MRGDSLGMFWQDQPVVRDRSGNTGPRIRPAVPDTGWSPPSSFPRLGEAKNLCIDVETFDPNLIEKGPGWATGDGHLCGIAVGTDDGHRWYFPMRHEDSGLNMDPEVVLRWARNELCRPDQLKIGANLMYDLGWLQYEGVDVKGPYYDIQHAEALLDEHRRHYSLDSIAKDRGLDGKVSNELYQWCSTAFGGKANAHGQGKNIHRAPVELVGPYAEGDVDLPLKIMEQQLVELEAAGLNDLMRMEERLTPMLLAMRKRGVRIRDDWERVRSQLESKIIIPEGVDIWASATIERACKREGIAYKKTKTGKASFTADWLKGHEHPLMRQIATARKYEKATGTFFNGYLGKTVNGRLHGEFHPLRSDDGGTVSGRFSSSNPNLQNIPSRDPELGPLIRSLFVPDEGEDWAKLDYSQVEYRLLTHFARGEGADRVRRKYLEDARVDFHQMVSEMSGLDRKSAKNLNFGMIYGQGADLTASVMGVSRSEADAFRAQYFEQAPFVKFTSDWVARVAGQRGHLKSIGGRYHRFPHWEPADWSLRGKVPMEKDRDLVEHLIEEQQEIARASGEKVPRSGVVRARTHKSLNALLQGSAADIMKLAMVDVWESGVCDVLGAPLLTVHDELDFSVPRSAEGHEALREAKRLMEDCYKLGVPLICDAELGPNWAEVKSFS